MMKRGRSSAIRFSLFLVLCLLLCLIFRANVQVHIHTIIWLSSDAPAPASAQENALRSYLEKSQFRDKSQSRAYEPQPVFQLAVPVYQNDERLKVFLHDASRAIRAFYQQHGPKESESLLQFRIQVTRFPGENTTSEFLRELHDYLVLQNNDETKGEHSRSPPIHLQFAIAPSHLSYSRAKAINLLQDQAHDCRTDECIFCVLDVDMVFQPDFITRAQSFLRKSSTDDRQKGSDSAGQDIYFPIVFSEYDPIAVRMASHIFGPLTQFIHQQRMSNTTDENEELHFLSHNDSDTNQQSSSAVYDHSEHAGLFRIYGYGMFAMRGSSTRQLYLNESFSGWGGEDNDFFNRASNSTDIHVIREREPDLIHVFHPKSCERGWYITDNDFLQRCISSHERMLGSPLLQWLNFTNGPAFEHFILHDHTALPTKPRSTIQARTWLSTQYQRYWNTRLSQHSNHQPVPSLDEPWIQQGDSIRVFNNPHPTGISAIVQRAPYQVHGAWFFDLTIARTNEQRSRVRWLPQYFQRDGLLIAIETTQVQLETRVKQGILQSWAKVLPPNVQIVFFVGEMRTIDSDETIKTKTSLSSLQEELEIRAGIHEWNAHNQHQYSRDNRTLPLTRIAPQVSLVALPGLEDQEYPPVHKNAMLIQHLARLLEQRAWESPEWSFPYLFKADDDTYVNIPQLLKAIRKMEAKSPFTSEYYGRRGKGSLQEREALVASGAIQEPYCLGGPGYLLNQLTLRRLASSMNDCLAELKLSCVNASVAWHSDVLIGMCVTRTSGIGCFGKRDAHYRTFGNKFAQVYMDRSKKAEWMNKTSLWSSISVHPIKNFTEMRQFHQIVEDDFERQEKKRLQQVESAQEKKNQQQVGSAPAEKKTKKKMAKPGNGIGWRKRMAYKLREEQRQAKLQQELFQEREALWEQQQQ